MFSGILIKFDFEFESIVGSILYSIFYIHTVHASPCIVCVYACYSLVSGYINDYGVTIIPISSCTSKGDTRLCAMI